MNKLPRLADECLLACTISSDSVVDAGGVTRNGSHLGRRTYLENLWKIQLETFVINSFYVQSTNGHVITVAPTPEIESQRNDDGNYITQKTSDTIINTYVSEKLTLFPSIQLNKTLTFNYNPVEISSCAAMCRDFFSSLACNNPLIYWQRRY